MAQECVRRWTAQLWLRPSGRRPVRPALVALLLFGTLAPAACGSSPDEYTYVPPDSYYDLPGGVSRVPSAPTQTYPSYAAPQRQTNAVSVSYGAPGDVVDEYTYVPPDSYYDLPGGMSKGAVGEPRRQKAPAPEVSRVPSAPARTEPSRAAPQRQMTQDEVLMWMLLSQQRVLPAPPPPSYGPKIQCFGSGNSFHCY